MMEDNVEQLVKMTAMTMDMTAQPSGVLLPHALVAYQGVVSDNVACVDYPMVPLLTTKDLVMGCQLATLVCLKTLNYTLVHNWFAPCGKHLKVPLTSGTFASSNF